MTTPTIGQSLTDTIHGTVDFVQKHLQPILLGAIIFGGLTWATSYALVGRQAAMLGEKAGMMGQGAEEWGKKMEDLGNRMERGDMAGMTDEQAAEMARNLVGDGMKTAGVSGGMLGGLLAGAGLTLLIAMIIGVVARAYYTLIAVKGLKDVQETLNMSLKWAWPLFLLGLWIALRSFIWIPVVGLFIAIFLGPRFILAPLYMIEQGKGVMESASLSYAKTSKDWLRIFVVGLVIGLGTLIISVILGMVLSMFGMLIGGVLRSVLGELISAVMMIAMITLGRSIMSQPVAAVAPAAPAPTPAA
jgi:hypothetical protein